MGWLLRRAVELAALAGMLGACQSVRPALDDTAPLVDVVREQEAAWNRGDIEGFLAAGYWRSEELTFLSGGDWNRGYEPVLARYRRRYTEGDAEMGQLAFRDLEAQRLAADVGLVRGSWHLTFSDASEAGGLFTLVLRRLPEGWRIVHDHTSSAEEAE